MTARPSRLDPAIARLLKRDENGLFPAVVQQHDTGEVLMVAWMDDEALHRTLTTGRATYWSRSRSEYWVKGETSGHVQFVRSVALDCDGDTVLVRVEQVGPACHTGSRTCFDGRELPVAQISGAGSGSAAVNKAAVDEAAVDEAAVDEAAVDIDGTAPGAAARDLTPSDTTTPHTTTTGAVR